MKRSPRTEFDQVDQTRDPADVVRDLDATRATGFFQEIKRRRPAAISSLAPILGERSRTVPSSGYRLAGVARSTRVAGGSSAARRDAVRMTTGAAPRFAP